MTDNSADTLGAGTASGADWNGRPSGEGSAWKRARFDLDRGYSFWLGYNSVRMFPGGFELPRDFNLSERGFAYTCAMLLEPNSNMLARHTRGRYVPLTVAGLAKETGISMRQCQTYMSRMISRNIVKRADDRHLYMNPLYFIRGRYLTWGLYHLFQEDLDPFLPDWVIDRFNGDINA